MLKRDDVMSREAFDKLSVENPLEASKFIQSGGTLVDVPAKSAAQ